MRDPGGATPRPTVWIVDDSPTEAAITERSLGDRYVFEKFGDGSTVVERISTATRLPDLLLLDWVMPGMTGDEVCRFLRARPQTRELPIIMVTASRIETDDIVAGLAIGANDYVPRPFAPEELRARVEAALRTKHLADFATRERHRLATVNQLGHALFQIAASPRHILDELASALTTTLCDGCSILILPGLLPEMVTSRHRHDPSGDALAQIAALADPVVHAFASSDEARATLPPAYASYIDRFGLRGLAILPFPTRDPIRGVVTVTREDGAQPFDTDDITTIETCIEYASLAIERVVRVESERVERKQLDTVLASLPIGILATDADGAVTLVNAAAATLLPEVRTATTLAEVFRLPGWTAADGSPVSDDAVLLGRGALQLPVAVDLRLRTAGAAEPRTIAVSAVPLRDGDQVIVGSVTVLEDVSAERAVGVERERISRFQEDMLAIVGHDLRSPLGAVLTGTELLQHSIAEDSPQSKTVRRMQSSARRMTRIIEQLLDVTHVRLGSGIPISLEATQLLPLVTAVTEELALAYPKTRFEVRGEDITGHWDADRLSQVVSNLASNAAQYGRAGDPVQVELSRRGELAMITVHNTVRDAPISAETIASMFQPYRRGGASGHASGLGLGLYIVNAIVAAHHGSIEVESTADGTVFRVLLPTRLTR